MNMMEGGFVGPDASQKPSFLVTIDTEGDNLWARPRKVTTKNAELLYRFQSLCKSYSIRPTYLVNYEMANSSSFRDFGRDILKHKNGEIGMHLHAWDTPPLVSLTEDDSLYHPYLFEYPNELIQEKVNVMTDLLKDVFGVEPISHRAGRWGLNEKYARILVRSRYRIDCSVTPFISWEPNLGDPKRNGGPNYFQFSDDAYFVDLDDISRQGNSPLLEIPMTIQATKRLTTYKLIRQAIESHNLPINPSSHLGKRIIQKPLNRLFPAYWLRPNGRNVSTLLTILKNALHSKKKYVMLMLHSSELMPGGSPTFPRKRDIEALYGDLDVLFRLAKKRFQPLTLKEYYRKILECQ